jgi:hypothetical protein
VAGISWTAHEDCRIAKVLNFASAGKVRDAAADDAVDTLPKRASAES